MMLLAEVVLLGPVLDWMLITTIGLAILMLLIAPRDVTRRQPLPELEENPDPLPVAYLRRQSSGVIEVMIYDLVEAGQLEVIEDEEDFEFYGMQQVPGSAPPEIASARSERATEEPGIEDVTAESDESISGDEESVEDVPGDDQGEESGVDVLEALSMATRRIIYDYFDEPKFPRQALAQQGGLRSQVGQVSLPIHQHLMQRHLMTAVASGQGCAAGCLLMLSIISGVAFVIGSLVAFAGRAFQGGDVVPLAVLVVVLLLIRFALVRFKPRLTRVIRFLHPRTRWGEAYLEELEDRFFAMLPAPSDANGNGDGQPWLDLGELPGERRQELQRLAVAVFGSWVLEGGPYEEVAFYLGTADPPHWSDESADTASGEAAG